MTMNGALLSDEERHRFAGWLEREIVSGEAMIGQFETMKLPAALVTRKKNELLAAKIILQQLRSIESVTVGK